MEHKQFIEELQSRLGKDKKEIDNLFSDMLQILKDRCRPDGYIVYTRIRDF